LVDFLSIEQKSTLWKGACDSYLIATRAGTVKPAFCRMFTVNASKKIRGSTTKSSPLSEVKSLKSKIDLLGFEISTLGVSTFAVSTIGVGVAAALRDFVAVARLRLTGAFLAGVLTVAFDAGI